MTFDLANLRDGEVAVLAGAFTLFAAFTAAVAALVVAKINAWAAVSLDRQKAKREYYKGVLDPFLETLEADTARYTEMAQILSRLHIQPQLEANLVPLSTATDRERYRSLWEKLYKPSTQFDDLAPAVRSIFERDRSLRERFSAFCETAKEMRDVFSISKAGLEKGVPEDHQPKLVRDGVNLLARRVFDVRIAAEHFIYNEKHP